MAAKLSRQLFLFAISCYHRLSETYRALQRYLRINAFYQRFHFIRRHGDATSSQSPRHRVLVGIVHITSYDEHRNQAAAETKVQRLRATIDGLLTSFAHCELTLRVISMAERHIVAFLPSYQRQCIQLQEESDCDPMFIGYRVHDTFIREQNDYDWFLFIEDDIEIRDANMFDKLQRFSALPNMERAVLMPNRFEMWEGVKRYIDLTPFNDIAWNKLSVVMLDGFKLAECTNPHAGMFCLSQRQMREFAKSRRDWHGRDVYGGSRESAATFSLMEYFRLYKPHPQNLHYFECRHVDTKYSQLHPDSEEFTFSALRASSSQEVGLPVPSAQ